MWDIEMDDFLDFGNDYRLRGLQIFSELVLGAKQIPFLFCGTMLLFKNNIVIGL